MPPGKAEALDRDGKVLATITLSELAPISTTFGRIKRAMLLKKAVKRG